MVLEDRRARPVIHDGRVKPNGRVIDTNFLMLDCAGLGTAHDEERAPAATSISRGIGLGERRTGVEGAEDHVWVARKSRRNRRRRTGVVRVIRQGIAAAHVDLPRSPAQAMQ